MTKTSMALTELAEKGPDLDMLREMLEFATQRLIEFDVENRCGAPYGERGVPPCELAQRLSRSDLGNASRLHRSQDS